MKNFDNELRAASEKYIEPAAAETGASCPAELDARVGALLEGKSGEVKRRRNPRWTAVIAVAAVVALLGAAVAAAPIVRSFLNVESLKTAERLTEVPDGWVGVYTAADLDAVRNDLTGRYILMEDVTFDAADFEEGGAFAGGWTPIGTAREPFTGMFDGNGHVVRGLVIDAENTAAVGLFGCCKTNVRGEVEKTRLLILPGGTPENGLDVDGDGIIDGHAEEVTYFGEDYLYEEWSKSGTVKWLGIEDSSIRAAVMTAEGNAQESFSGGYFVGAVAGYAEFTLGCYVKNTTVDVTIPEDGVRSVSVGGVAGGTYLTDSCVSAADITVSGYSEKAAVGGVTGLASACVTSYFAGSIDSACGDAGVAAIVENEVPKILSEDAFMGIYIRLWPLERASGTVEAGVNPYIYPDHYNETVDRLTRIWEDSADWEKKGFPTRVDAFFEAEKEFAGSGGDTSIHLDGAGWQAEKFSAFYCTTDALKLDEEAVRNLYLEDTEDGVFYMLDPGTKTREYRELRWLIEAGFPDGDFMDFCAAHHVKYGSYYCYDLRTDPDCAFEGFDFDGIWNTSDGALPTLSIFGD